MKLITYYVLTHGSKVLATSQSLQNLLYSCPENKDEVLIYAIKTPTQKLAETSIRSYVTEHRLPRFTFKKILSV